MPGTRFPAPRDLSPDEIVYREYGGLAPHVSVAARRARPVRTSDPSWAIGQAALAELVPPVGASPVVLAIVCAVLAVADATLS